MPDKTTGRFLPGEHWRERKPFWDAEWLRNEYAKHTAKEIAARFGVTAKAVVWWAQRHGIYKGHVNTAVLGETKTIRGKLRQHVQDKSGNWYWRVVREPVTVEKVMQQSVQSRRYWRKKGMAIPATKPGVPVGFKRSLATRIKQSISARRYLFDVHAIASDQKHRIRRSIIYKVWRESVFERDNFTCQKCGDRNGNGHAVILEAHHKKSWAHFPNFRFEVSNGLTLCRTCHRKITSKRMRSNQNGRKKSNAMSIGAVQTADTLF